MKTITRSSADPRLTACSRRQALGLLGLGAVAGTGAVPGLALAATPAAPVQAYFRDGLLRDTSGRLPAWRAPRGHRGAGQVATLSEEARIRAGIVF
ncbi:hypothetical protein [Alteraurantiacibacter buctensis]|uniref:Uncharacterized protein n=1 Tax=Alteraurantiacibacter buctensis TaxID=1503981 RepID=A0A844YT50_9SPHN|nr:hypothetical protein [Alteraurantiacibacter buctensis]MXO70196.1 hypothetical protein [Alteraurantiacibacter buctensis]